MAVEQIGTDNLLAAMEADPSVAQQILELEQKLHLTTRVESTVAALPAEQVQVTGAVLNVETGDTTTLRIGEAETSALPEAYDGMNAVTFSLSLTNVAESGGHQYLVVPVRITLPIPEDYAPGQVRVLHRISDTVWDELTPVLSEEGGRWYASVVVTQLSDFAMVADRSVSSVVMTAAGQIQVTVGTLPDAAKTLCAAVYNGQGRMIALKMTQLQPDQAVYTVDAGLQAAPQGGEVRAYFLDAQYRPVSACRRYTP